MPHTHPSVQVEYPAWVDAVVDWDKHYTSDLERMRLAIDVSRANVDRGDGGPFGAAIFETDSGRVRRFRSGRLPEVAWVERCG